MGGQLMTNLIRQALQRSQEFPEMRLTRRKFATTAEIRPVQGSTGIDN